ncbi:Putative cytochrome c, soxE homolog [Magnetospirillum sp. XM-1]|uniref:c-type cytochrome n=1 Tax=Magnetospirillum sp. XM-1 TaxID=1663591 RepID=UPI00073DD7D2|nr:sulfide dehydrogenase [Magnetospirillum sp. XM-1]CUW39995.1 Putative cytochrome c, soxE homolog [Magnetospirillum sp. XM-1]
MRRVAVFTTLMMIAAAPAVRADGVARVMADTCTACHSTEIHSFIPTLAGRPAGELLRMLLAFRDGGRVATIMDRIAKGYSREQLGAIAGELSARGAP